MKHVLVVALVVVVLVTGIPLVMAMPAGDCADCGIGMMMASTCVFAVLTAAVGLALVLLAMQLRMRAIALASLLATSGLDRPPRLA
ncbi:MAG: hypothetical protein M3N68_12245 [Actinomycetota bacterium]|nr:hypothetical protein [Actinomycetota bacterium]